MIYFIECGRNEMFFILKTTFRHRLAIGISTRPLVIVTDEKTMSESALMVLKIQNPTNKLQAKFSTLKPFAVLEK